MIPISLKCFFFGTRHNHANNCFEIEANVNQRAKEIDFRDRKKPSIVE
jgi:hypothetical protein